MPHMGDSNHFNRRQQPRVPKGYTGGGRFTDGDDQGEPTGKANSRFLHAESGAVVQSENLGTDRTRHTVTLPDGSVVIFEQNADLHRVYENGKLVESYRWTNSGLVQEPILQPALFDDRRSQRPRNGRAAAFAAVAALLRWWQGGKVIALGYDLEAERTGGSSPVPMEMTEEEVRSACKRYDEARSILTTAEATVRRLPGPWKPWTYGTKVHVEAAHIVNGTIIDSVTGKPRFRMSEEAQDPNFVGEMSISRALAADPTLTRPEAIRQRKSKYALGGTVRLDLLENVDGKNDLICVYDFKTGAEGLEPDRFLELKEAIRNNFPLAKRLVIIEMRPG
jgi:hypothetical protein